MGAVCPILAQRGQPKWYEIQECSKCIPADNVVSEKSAWIWLPASSLVIGLLPGFIFVWDFLGILGNAVRGIRCVWSAPALTWVSLGVIFVA